MANLLIVSAVIMLIYILVIKKRHDKNKAVDRIHKAYTIIRESSPQEYISYSSQRPEHVHDLVDLHNDILFLFSDLITDDFTNNKNSFLHEISVNYSMPAPISRNDFEYVLPQAIEQAIQGASLGDKKYEIKTNFLNTDCCIIKLIITA